MNRCRKPFYFFVCYITDLFCKIIINSTHLDKNDIYRLNIWFIPHAPIGVCLLYSAINNADSVLDMSFISYNSGLTLALSALDVGDGVGLPQF